MIELIETLHERAQPGYGYGEPWLSYGVGIVLVLCLFAMILSFPRERAT